MLEVLGDIVLTDQYWDCECRYDFIHPAEWPTCPICGTERESQPDSRVNELLEIGFSVPESDASLSRVYHAKRLGIAWLKDHVKIEEWPATFWKFVSTEFVLNICVDMNDKLRARVFSVYDAEIDFENPIEVV